MRFRTAQEAEHSPLAKRLFALEGTTGVSLQGEQVTVTHKPAVNWREVGPLIGQAIRAHVASGEPAVSPEGLKSRSTEDSLRSRVQKVIDEQINPAVASHGGVISLIDVQGTAIYIQMGGGCQGCGQANVTLRDGIEESLKQQVPEITDSDLYLRYVLGEVPARDLLAAPERHLRCNPALAQYIVDAAFAPLTVPGDFGKAGLDPTFVRAEEARVSAGYRRLLAIPTLGLSVPE